MTSATLNMTAGSGECRCHRALSPDAIQRPRAVTTSLNPRHTFGVAKGAIDLLGVRARPDGSDHGRAVRRGDNERWLVGST